MRPSIIVAFAFVSLVSIFGQQPDQPAVAITSVPRLVRVTGTFHPATALPVGAVESVTLSIYKEQQGGTALWQETQNVNLDSNGQYAAVLGVSQTDGVPLDLFSSGEPRWLGVQFNRPGETEQPRVQLVSVPYALKASDAETLGGLPAAAYMRVQSGQQLQGQATGEATSVETSSASGNQKAEKPRAITGTPSNRSLVKFTDSAGDIGNSIVTDNGSSVAVAGQAAVGSGHASQTYGFDLYVNGNSPSALIDAYGNPGTASLLLQGRSSIASNHALSVNSNGLFSITPSGTGIPAFSINQSGSLMAGTISPWAGAKLQVRPGTNQNLAIGGPLSLASGVTFHSFNDAITANEGFEFRGSPIVFSVGNVGIGTPTPGSKLDVAGDINFTGNLLFNSGYLLRLPGFGLSVGPGALAANASGNYNTAIGNSALLSNTVGNSNTAVGSSTLSFNTSGSNNTAIGFNALSDNVNGVNNTAIGAGVLLNNSTGSHNTGNGYEALASNTAGINNTAIGSYALLSSKAANQNTAVGAGALQNNIVDGNTAVGYDALNASTTGTGNTAHGANALAHNASGSFNTAVGLGALQQSSSDGNTATGYNALSNNTTGTYNTATGIGALDNNTVGVDNTAAGGFALLNNTTGGNNTAVGFEALVNNTVGGGNTAFGGYALELNTIGITDTAIGYQALADNSTGGDNTANGAFALQNNTSGNNNIALGFNAALNVSGGNSNNIHIGTQGASADNGTIRIGGNTNLGDPVAQTSLYLAGVTSNALANGVPLAWDTTTQQVGYTSSSRRYKEDIQDMGDASAGLMRLRPVTFRYRKSFADGSKPIQYGLIAEEVAEVYPDLVARGADEQLETVKYQVLDSMLLNEVQRQEKEIGLQRDRIAKLEQKNAALEERLAKLEAAIRY